MSVQNEAFYIVPASATVPVQNQAFFAKYVVFQNEVFLVKSIVPPAAPCSLSRLLNLPVLTPPASKSIISSSLWNAIVNNIYSAYNSLSSIHSALLAINYMNILDEAQIISNSLSTPTPYVFTPLLTASKGVPLTAGDFNALVSALEKVYSLLQQSPPNSVSPASGDETVSSSTFTKIVNDLNTLRQSALQSVLLVSTTGAELNDLPDNFAGQNVLVCSISTPATLAGSVTVENLLVVSIPDSSPSVLTLSDNTSVNRLVAQAVGGTLQFEGTANAGNVVVGVLYGTLSFTDFASVQNVFVNNILIGGQLVLTGNAYVENLEVLNCSPGSILVEDYAIIKNLFGKAAQCVSTS